MKKGLRLSVLLPVIFGLLLSVFALSNITTPKVLASDDKVNICHATDSNSNPYEKKHPDKSADVGGHNGHNGPVWFSGIDEKWGDIIPPFDYGDDQHYDGKNWTTEGQAFWNNNCERPASPTPSPTPWSVQITKQDYSCGVEEVTIQGTAQYDHDTSTTLLVKVNGEVVIDSESEPTNWSTTISVVPGQSYTVEAFVFDKNNPNEDTKPKATDTWRFTIGEDCSEATPTPSPTPAVGGGEQKSVGGNITTPSCPSDRPQQVDQVWFTDVKPGEVTVNWANKGDAWGFQIAYGPTKDNLIWGVEVSDSKATQYTLKDLPGGDLWVSVIAKSSKECGGPGSDPKVVGQVLGASTLAATGNFKGLALFLSGFSMIALGLWQAQKSLSKKAARS